MIRHSNSPLIRNFIVAKSRKREAKDYRDGERQCQASQMTKWLGHADARQVFELPAEPFPFGLRPGALMRSKTTKSWVDFRQVRDLPRIKRAEPREPSMRNTSRRTTAP